MAKGQRAPKWTPAKAAKVVELVGQGVSRTGAAALVGVHETTVSYHMERDPDFAAAIARAERVMEASMLGLIQVHSVTDWRAAAWLLERRFRDLYGQRAELAVHFDIEVAVAKVAKETGLDAATLLAAAEDIVREAQR